MDTPHSTIRDYGFPYEPYDIQVQLMDQIYDSIALGKVAILESPTGTGKSLSIICAMLKWLSDYKENTVTTLNEKLEKLTLNCQEESSKDWVSQQLKQLSLNKEAACHKQSLEVINKHISYTRELKKKAKLKKFNDTSKLATFKRSTLEDDFDAILDEDNELIVKYCESDALESEESKLEDHFRPKVYYCSRTHSQLSQFINEIKKTKKFINNDASLMTVPLSSRVNYCINPNVNRSSNVNIINEKCNQLQSGKQKCTMYNHTYLRQLSEDILATTQDLEDIVSSAKHYKACPYYASRLSVSEAEIVILPYNILFHKSTRESFGIHLKDSIVIIDEAHNLLETLASIYSIEIRLGQLKVLFSLLVRYMTKYNTRFNTLNLMYLKQLIFVIKKLISILSKSTTDTASYDPLNFVLQLEIEHINIYKLVEFIDKSHIASKLHMFSLKPSDCGEDTTKKSKISGTKSFLSKFQNSLPVASAKVATSQNEPKNLSANETEALPQEHFNSNMVYSLKELLLSLKDFSVDGKILLNFNKANPVESTCKYILLNSSHHFKEIVFESRAVILCGGTMKPFDDYINQLFKPLNIANDRIVTFSCDHVIEKDNLIAIGMGRGPNGIELNYTFTNRSLPKIVAETGQALVQLCQVIPKGMVVFFSSYDYAEFMLKEWQQMGIMRTIEKFKRVFKEPKKSSLTAHVLNSYSRFVHSNQQYGAILFSVIGGKMSEGINFSDNLGRAAIVIGLPYPNRNSIELKEKMSYLSRISPDLANEHYENLCMRAVNQSIGRAIRHKNDYATIILLDNRYCSKQTVKMKLPEWIKSRYQVCDNFTNAIKQVKTFFQNKETTTAGDIVN